MMKKRKPKSGIFIGDTSDDVLEIIFSGLPQDATLIAIARVCKRFKALVLPLLYRNIHFEAKHMNGRDYSTVKPNELPPDLEPDSLRFSLNAYPYLRIHVRKLSLKVHNVSWYEISGGYQRLITLLPSIQELSLNPPPKEYEFPMSDRLITMKLDVSYEHGGFWAPKRLNDATSFDLNNYLSKRTLRKLQFEHIERLYFNPIHTGNPASSTITDLRFIHWLPERVGVLESVLPSIRHLEHFVLEVGGYWQGGSTYAMAPHDYGFWLQPHSASLETLIIAYSDEAFNDGTNFPRRPTPFMGTLINYHNLKRLALPEPLLVSIKDPSFHEMLPPQLEELQIQYPAGVLHPVWDRNGDGGRQPPYRLMRMQKLAKDKQSLAPRLKHVVWWFQQTSQQVSIGNPPPYHHQTPSRTNATRVSDDPRKGPVYGPLEDMDDLAEDFRKVGVKFEWVSTPYFEETPFVKHLRIQ